MPFWFWLVSVLIDFGAGCCSCGFVFCVKFAVTLVLAGWWVSWFALRLVLGLVGFWCL